MQKIFHYIVAFFKTTYRLIVSGIYKLLGLSEEDVITNSLKNIALAIIFSVVVVTAVFFITLFVIIATSPTVKVPNLEYKSLYDALVELQSLGLVPIVEPAYEKEVPKYFIVNQFPKPNNTVKRGAKIRLIVNLGVDVTVPNLVGMKEEDAVRLLISSGLRVGNVNYVANPNIPEGMVITQYPKPGKVVSRNTKVNMIVSTGKYLQKEVPNYVGYTYENAVRDVITRGFKYSVTPVLTKSAEEDGKVIMQDPEPGTKLPLGSTINLTVGVFGISPEKLAMLKFKVYKIKLPSMETLIMMTNQNTNEEANEEALRNAVMQQQQRPEVVTLNVKVVLSDMKSERTVFEGIKASGDLLILPLKIWGGGVIKVYVNGLLFKEDNV